MDGKQPDSFEDELNLQLKVNKGSPDKASEPPASERPEADLQKPAAGETKQPPGAVQAEPEPSDNDAQESRSNFRTAWDELFGKRKEEQTAQAEGRREKEEDRMPDYGSVNGKQSDHLSASRHDFSTSALSGNPQTSVISSGTVIEGNITSEGHIQVAGTVKGNIAAKGNVRVTGSVEGDISGDLIDLNACAVTGNLSAEATVSIDSGSRLSGNIASHDLIADGTIQGNLSVGNSAVLKVHASLRGNISAAALSVEQGAVICGEVKIEQRQSTPE